MESQVDGRTSSLDELLTRLTLRHSPPPPTTRRTHFQRRNKSPPPPTNFRGREITSLLPRRSLSMDFSSLQFAPSRPFPLPKQQDSFDFEEDLGPPSIRLPRVQSSDIDFKKEMDDRKVPVDIRVEIVSYVIYDYMSAILENHKEVSDYLGSEGPLQKVTRLVFNTDKLTVPEVMAFLRVFNGTNSLIMPVNCKPNNFEETQELFKDIVSLKKLKFLDMTLSDGVNNKRKHPADMLIQKLTSKNLLEHLNLTGYTLVNGISVMQECTHLQYLNLAGCNLNDRDLVHVATFVHLTFLNISFNIDITDKGFRLIKNSTLTHLDISGLDITDAGIFSIKDLSNITELLLSKCHRITSNALVIIGRFPALEHLYVNECIGINGHHLDKLNVCRTIKHLDISNCHHVTIENFKSVDLPNLSYLDISGCLGVTKSLKVFHKFRNLKTLIINNTSVSHSEIDHLKSFIPNLTVKAVDARYKSVIMRENGIN